MIEQIAAPLQSTRLRGGQEKIVLPPPKDDDRVRQESNVQSIRSGSRRRR
jgi:hypothetical protein